MTMDALIDTGAFSLGGKKRWGRLEGRAGRHRVGVRGLGWFPVQDAEILELRPVYLDLPEAASRLGREVGELEVMIERHPRYWKQRPRRIRTTRLENWLAEQDCEQLMAMPVRQREWLTAEEIAAIVRGDA